jgi:hypothetical protein
MLRKYWLRATAYVVAVGLAAASIHWPRSSNIGTIATILLLLVTFEYVLTTQENLGLFRHQLQRQEKVFLFVDLVVLKKVFIRVSNLGMTNFLVTGMRVRTQDIAKFNWSTHRVVETGQSELIELPAETLAKHPLSVDVEITLEIVGLDIKGTSEPKVFNISMGLDEVPEKAREGLDGLWTVRCPRCGLGGLIVMSLEGLETFDDAFARKNEMETDLKDSCPNHETKWLLKQS